MYHVPECQICSCYEYKISTDVAGMDRTHKVPKQCNISYYTKSAYLSLLFNSLTFNIKLYILTTLLQLKDSVALCRLGAWMQDTIDNMDVSFMILVSLFGLTTTITLQSCLI